MKTFKMLVEIGQPFPEPEKEYEFVGKKAGATFIADVWFVKTLGWETKGKIGVYVEVSVIVKKITSTGKQPPKLKLV